MSDSLRLDVVLRIKRWARRGDRVTIAKGDHILVELRGRFTPAVLSRLRRMMRAIAEMPFYSEDDLRHLDVGTSWIPLSGNAATDKAR